MFSAEEFIQIMVAKTLLLGCGFDDLVNICKDKRQFLEFLQYVDLLFDKESVFFVFDRDQNNGDIRDRILDLIHEYRFLYKEQENVVLYNSIISKINNIYFTDTCNDGVLQMTQYFLFQQEAREREFKSVEEMFDFMVQDILLYNYLTNGSVESIRDLDKQYIISSMNYFLCCFPHLYDERVMYNKNMALLDTTIEESRVFSKARRCAMKTKRKFERFKILRIQE